MKKTLAAVLAVCVILGAGAAFAQGFNSNNAVREHRNQQAMNRPELRGQEQFGNFAHMPNRFEGRDGRPEPHRDFRGHCRREKIFTPDMPKEIREKAAELAKLRIDLEEALSSRPINKAKALEVHAKMQTLKNEIDTWRFEKRLERMENFQKQRELNKKIPPAKPQAEPKEAE